MQRREHPPADRQLGGTRRILAVAALGVSLALLAIAFTDRGAGGGGAASCRAAALPAIPIFRQSARLPRPGEGVLHLTARAPGSGWDRAGAESAVVTVSLDGTPNQEVVLCTGDRPHTYDLLLGPVGAGEHTVTVALRPDLSPSGARAAAAIDRARVEVVPADDPRYPVLAHAPLLYGRPDNAASDLPLIAFYEERASDAPAGGGRHLIYSMLWSNEDGGTGGNVGSLMARWGRSTDIEWIFDAFYGADGRLQRAVIQAGGHHTSAFQGDFRGGHPLLRTATTNNMVADSGTSPLLFALAPLRAVHPSREPREAVMDAAPWAYRLTAEEMGREGKYEAPGDPNTVTASDARSYLYVDYAASVQKPALLAVAVRLRDGRVFVSDHGNAKDAIGRSGWVRTAIELPPGTPPDAVAALWFVRRDAATADAVDAAAAARVRSVRAFFLDRDYRPLPPILIGSGDRAVIPGVPFAPFPARER